MADFTSSPSPSTAAAACSLFEKPIALTAASSSSQFPPPSAFDGALDEGVEDGCCICLEPFTVHDPTTVTNCRHEYHLHCILEWSQRSKECPICWQSFVLKDPASQQLLDAVRIERNCMSTNTPVVPTDLHYFYDSFGVEEDAFHSDDSDFDEHILQHLALAASRVRYARRRERQISSGLGPSQASGIPSVNTSPQSPVTPSVNMVSSAACSGDEAIKLSQPPVGTPSRPSSVESVSFSEFIKSKWSNASARYKESISKGTKGLKEKLLSRNNSVKELSKGVQREMSAGVAKMIERLDISSKRPEASKPASGGTGRTLNILFKGKAVEENVIAQGLSNNRVEFAHGLKSEAPSHLSSVMPDKLEASLHQVSQTFL
ncbi:P-loop containing nucleoside triphosphate hydrolases superfamily protein isoform 1 [Hibiscus syriacus]|uniref:RING-type E3 ubiquitin transferase n=1 Tax=Hibiscus syriacus TaxID=106335 RepID=A0A6A3BNG8_HIBSY|nr:P-loop containing nucleoside triphosphate hydrolases superfamily protein isoform 1 [Hibiscus syriacus]